MFKALRRWWKYITAKFSRNLENRADPSIQLEQAITEAKEQDRRLREQAANVIATQKQAEIKLEEKMGELEKLNANARQAIIMAEDAVKKGDTAKSTQYQSAAETIATRLIQIERDIESQKALVMQSTQAADQAKAAVRQNSMLLEQKISEKSKLLSQLEQAKMQEEMTKAMRQLNETLGDDVPTFQEIKEKIDARYAKAVAATELESTSVDSSILEIEQASANAEARSRLAQMRAELGLDSGTAVATTPEPAAIEAPAPAQGTPAAETPATGSAPS
jgi:phage shock protein A